MIETPTIITIIIGILLLIIGAIVWHLIFSLINYIRVRSRFKKGKKGEVIARKYLKHHGFTIISQQVSEKSQIIIDGKGYTYEVRADFLVKKGEITGIVEVKSGFKATNPLSIPTRRQLFEYYHIFQVDVLYFFDANKRELQAITFLTQK
ncbi:MAG: hypothetical protein JXJ04_00305 [Spirochaetales bacterium]|nr:hypothetical protein [Spirochaetales bacterium]